MTTMYKYYEDVYVEIELGYNEEDILSMSIVGLDSNGEISDRNYLHVAIDWNTNKYLLDMAIDVSETGHEGSDWWLKFLKSLSISK